MREELTDFHRIFSSTKNSIEKFMNMLSPVIEHAENEYERLYFHHIYEEEQQRLDRLALLIPLIEKFQTEDTSMSPTNIEFNRLLQELNLEKFGLHNFVEHLDLALFQFTDEERHIFLKETRETSHQDYQTVKEMLAAINNRFQHEPSAPPPIKAKIGKKFTVGSLKK